MVWDITWVLTLGTSIRQSEGPAWTKVSESSVRSLQKYLHHQIVCISHNIYKKEEFTPPPTSVLIAPHVWTGRWKATTTLRKQASIAEHRARTIRSPLMRVWNARYLELNLPVFVDLSWALVYTTRYNSELLWYLLVVPTAAKARQALDSLCRPRRKRGRPSIYQLSHSKPRFEISWSDLKLSTLA